MLWISIGRNRFDKKWKSIEITWADLVKKLQKPIVTAETINQYLGFSKDKQSEIKDTGGYVGGIVKGGNRVAKNIQSRSLVTLDIDSPENGFWDDFCMLYTCSAVIHATHSSCKDHERYRLIIPLNRDVHVDEYEAIARKIAGTIGIESFDPTTFQPERLMYWPSVSSNVKYYFQEQKGQILDADEILDSYADWHDMSQWPIHDKVKKKLDKNFKDQEDPLEKEGLIGAFCRTYTISEVIDKYLSDLYEPCEIENRYTYKQGSTAAGLVVYDDKFIYSHHATDPISQKLCNAFDLLRLAKFGSLDENADPSINTAKLPSYLKVNELILKDKNVKKNLVGDKLKEAKIEFSKEELEDLDWVKLLDVDKKGNCYPTTQNVVIILENDPKLKNKFRYDEFNHRVTITSDLIWKKLKRTSDSWVNDSDLAHMRHYFETVYNISVAKKIEDGLDVVSTKNKYHPVIDYLKSCKWDGKERLECVLIDYLGADDNEYVRAVTRKTFVAAVARVFEPGCKYDNVLSLLGSQGMGKSQLLKKLGGVWFSDTFGSLQNNQAMEQLQGVWIMEIGEMAGLKRAEIESVKHFLAKCEDRFRVAYGHLPSIYPRQCIFIITTNEEDFLQDPTGNRRFWPVELNRKNIKQNVFALDKKTIDSIWAEAVYLYFEDETLYLNTEEEKVAELIQDKHTEQEVHRDLIEEYLNTKVPRNWYSMNIYDRQAFLSGTEELTEKADLLRYKITVAEIWTELLKNKIGDLNKFNAKSIKNVMRKIPGWEPKVIKVDNRTERGWINLKTQKVTKSYEG